MVFTSMHVKWKPQFYNTLKRITIAVFILSQRDTMNTYLFVWMFFFFNLPVYCCFFIEKTNYDLFKLYVLQPLKQWENRNLLDHLSSLSMSSDNNLTSAHERT